MTFGFSTSLCSAVFAGLTLVALSACSLITDTLIVMPGVTEGSVDEYLLKIPKKRYRDKFYESVLGEYRSSNLDIRERSSGDKKRLSVSPMKDVLLGGLIFGKWKTSRTAQYRFSRRRAFKFDLVDNNNTIAIHASCKYMSQLRQQKDVSLFLLRKKKSKHRSSSEPEWEASAMQCELKQGGQNYKLNLFSERDNEIEVEISSDRITYDLDQPENYQKQSISSNGTVNISQVQQSDLVEALRITRSGDVVGSITFTVPVQRISIAKNLSENARQVLLAAGYGLVLYSWLEDDWRGG